MRQGFTVRPCVWIEFRASNDIVAAFLQWQREEDVSRVIRAGYSGGGGYSGGFGRSDANKVIRWLEAQGIREVGDLNLDG